MRNLKISIKNLEKSFKEKKILKNLSLDIFESESLSIIGESGSGKSILTRCIVGLIDFEMGERKIMDMDKLKDILLELEMTKSWEEAQKRYR